jgi:hypothetical protein
MSCSLVFINILTVLCVAEEMFLVYARKQEISSVDLDVPTNNVMPAFTMPQVSSAIALDFDVDYIYWAENDTNSARYGINRAFLNGTAIESIIDYGKKSADSTVTKPPFTTLYLVNTSGLSVQAFSTLVAWPLIGCRVTSTSSAAQTGSLPYLYRSSTERIALWCCQPPTLCH